MMINKVINIFTLKFLLLSSLAIAETNSLFDATLKEHPVAGHYIELNNANSFFTCVDEHMLDAKNGFILFTNLKNSEEETFRGSTPQFPVHLTDGVDLSNAYLILLPNEKRQIYIDMSNFILHEGKYRYKFVLNLYKCNDITDEARLKAKRDVKSLSIEREGVVEFNKEFVRLNEVRAAAQKSKVIPVSLPSHEATHKSD